MKLVNAEQMRLIDKTAINDHNIPSLELMENAGRNISIFILDRILENKRNGSVAIFCGKGNNGGDGFVVARHLSQAGLKVVVYMISDVSDLSKDASVNYEKANGLEIEISQIKLIESLPEILKTDLIVDAVFGTGFSGEPKEFSSEIISYINKSKRNAVVVSVDVPSGLDATTGQHEGEVVQADFTLTLGNPKTGLYVTPGREVAGVVEIVPIGIPDEAVASINVENNLTLVTAEIVSKIIPKRKPDGHKGDFGKLYVLAGSNGMTGAAILTAKSSLRSGIGMVKVGTPKSVQSIIASLVIEATSDGLPDVGKNGKLALRGLGEILENVKNQDALVIGPGLGMHHETQELVRRVIARADLPIIIDADGLNAVAKNVDILKSIKQSLVVTPHPGEFLRLTKLEKYPTDIYEKIKLAADFAKEYSLTLVLKGSPTIIADKDGNGFLNSTGNNGMATGGSGDVLSGIIGTFLAQGLSSIDSAIVGVYLHGISGDLAAVDLTARSMTAGDIVEYLPESFRYLS